MELCDSQKRKSIEKSLQRKIALLQPLETNQTVLFAINYSRQRQQRGGKKSQVRLAANDKGRAKLGSEVEKYYVFQSQNKVFKTVNI